MASPNWITGSRLTPLVGYYLIKNTNTTLGGGSWSFRRVGEILRPGLTDIYCGIRFSERLEHKLTSTTKIWQSVSYVPDVERWMGITSSRPKPALTPPSARNGVCAWCCRMFTPAKCPLGIDNNELRLIAGTAYKF